MFGMVVLIKVWLSHANSGYYFRLSVCLSCVLFVVFVRFPTLKSETSFKYLVNDKVSYIPSVSTPEMALENGSLAISVSSGDVNKQRFSPCSTMLVYYACCIKLYMANDGLARSTASITSWTTLQLVLCRKRRLEARGILCTSVSSGFTCTVVVSLCQYCPA